MARKPGKTLKKRTYRKTRRGVNTKVSLQTGAIGCPFPPQFRTVHKFNNILHLDQDTAGIIKVQSYRLNMMYDMNYTNTTGLNNNQPLYYDQLTPIYKKYTVLGVKITVKGALNSSGYFTIRASNVLTIPSSIILELERPDAKHSFFVEGGNRSVMTYHANMSKIFGVPMQAIIDGDEYAGTDTATVPQNTAYLHVGFMNANVAALCTADYEISFEIDAIWSHRNEIAES